MSTQAGWCADRLLGREDLRLEGATTGEFKQSRIAVGADDRLVDPPSLFPSEDLARNLLAVHEHGEGRNDGVFGKWEQVRTFEVTSRLIQEYLIHPRCGHLILDLHSHGVRAQRQPARKDGPHGGRRCNGSPRSREGSDGRQNALDWRNWLNGDAIGADRRNG